MIKWIYNGNYLENKDLLFLIATLIIILIIIVTFILVWKELKHHENK